MRIEYVMIISNDYITIKVSNSYDEYLMRAFDVYL